MSANASEPAQQSSRRAPKKQSGGQHSSATSLTHAGATSAVVATDDQRDRIWELHLRGVSKTRIATDVGLYRATVGKVIQDCYRDFGAERRARMKRGLDGAVARMRHIQQQAWTDHDADDQREQAVLEKAEPGSRYTSQRSAYLRLALDAEKEIARLEGLYAEDAPDVLGVLFRIERVERRSSSATPAPVVDQGVSSDADSD